MPKHRIVTRFSVPRTQEAHHSLVHADPEWLDFRLRLFRAVFVPSVQNLGIPVTLLCSSLSADYVRRRTRCFSWLHVEVQNDWYGGAQASEDELVTRLDSDDAVCRRWFEAVDAAPPERDVYISRRFLRLDLERGKLSGYRRREPSPLATFRGGRNPFEHHHADLESALRTHEIDEAFLLQIFHGTNLSNRRPAFYRRSQPLEQLTRFGLCLDSGLLQGTDRAAWVGAAS